VSATDGAPPRYRTVGNRLQKVQALERLPDRAGCVALVTGGTDGVGREIAEQLATTGATVVLPARNRAKAERVRGEIAATTRNDDVHVVDLDLADLASVRRAADDVLARWDRLDLLVLDAAHQAHGARTVTADGLESTFGVNHVAHALLVSLLEGHVRASAPSRIVVVASEAHRRAKGGLDFDDLNMATGRFRPTMAYNRSKLANILYARELARRLVGSGVDVNAVHPGGVDTPMMRANFDRPVLRHLYPVARPLFISPADAAAGVLRVALDPSLSGTTGQYFELGLAKQPTDAARDDAAARRLWTVTDELIGR
jgi:NAD(P)-dependent dehydrogenase (short-subunit alcohol dehydrogenase family)